MKLLKAIDELESYVSKLALSNEAVSKSTIGWQIAHSLKVIYGVSKTVAKSNPKEYKWQFNFTRLVIFTSGKIPRGKAKAPKTVRPETDKITEENLLEFIQKSRKTIETAINSDPKAFVEHPFFGLLKRDKAMRFLEIHTEHHLKIIRDIAK
jgi:hypothetical protein